MNTRDGTSPRIVFSKYSGEANLIGQPLVAEEADLHDDSAEVRTTTVIEPPADDRCNEALTKGLQRR